MSRSLLVILGIRSKCIWWVVLESRVRHSSSSYIWRSWREFHAVHPAVHPNTQAFSNTFRRRSWIASRSSSVADALKWISNKQNKPPRPDKQASIDSARAALAYYEKSSVCIRKPEVVGNFDLIRSISDYFACEELVRRLTRDSDRKKRIP